MPGQDCELCGDGVVDPNETCDDGDLLDTNGCNDTCTTVAQYWYCPVGGMSFAGN